MEFGLAKEKNKVTTKIYGQYWQEIFLLISVVDLPQIDEKAAMSIKGTLHR